MPFFLIPFIGLAFIGLILSLISHLCGLLELPQLLGDETWALHIGVFVVMLPVIILLRGLVKDFKQKDMWKAALRGCPAWLRWLTYAFFAYAFTNFITFFIATFMNPPIGKHAAGDPVPPIVFRGFSGHWMAFYSMAVAIMYSALVVRKHDPARRCPNHHPVTPSALYCEVCGAHIGETVYPGNG